MRNKIPTPDFDVSFDTLYEGNHDRDKNISIIAHEIKRRIENGATVDQIAWYKSKTLKDVLSFFRIDGRSRLTYKEDMAERLVSVLGSVTDDTGLRSKKYSKDEDYDEADFIRLQNEVIHNIKKNGGLR